MHSGMVESLICLSFEWWNTGKVGSSNRVMMVESLNRLIVDAWWYG